MTPAQLQQITGCTAALATRWCAPLDAAMALHAIDSPLRQAYFLAQVGHESGGFVYTQELWGPTPAQVGYEGRADLGNTQPGDGMRFKGRGFIQITGRANYVAAAAGLGIDCVNQPVLLAAGDMPAISACWWWNTHGLNALADAGDLMAVTKRINGGTNGLQDRTLRTARALKAFGL
jgi:putative chitinase